MDILQDIRNFVGRKNKECRGIETLKKEKEFVLTIEERKLLYVRHSMRGDKYQLLQPIMQEKWF